MHKFLEVKFALKKYDDQYLKEVFIREIELIERALKRILKLLFLAKASYV